MEQLIEQVSKINILNQLWLTLFMLIAIVLISRSVVAGTKYSSILIIVIFGLSLGFILVKSGFSLPGLENFPIIGLMSTTTITALTVSFFVGGQEIRKILFKTDLHSPDDVILSDEEIFLGTKRTQFLFIVRAFFLLLSVQAIYKLVTGANSHDILQSSYLLFAFIGLVISIILIDHKAKIKNKQKYINRGLAEIALILCILLLSYLLSQLIKPVIGLPQIFFAMILSATLGMIFYKWNHGPTFKALLFAGIPIVLAANFLIGGSRIMEAFTITGMAPVITFGFFGQIFWMFFGLTLLIYAAKANHVRNLAPGMAGSLSHSGLTGACTAGDLGKEASHRAPVMINIPFIGHVFVFSILAVSASVGTLLLQYAIPVFITGIVLTVFSLRILRKAEGVDSKEVKGLMLFCLGWQLTAVFGSFTILSIFGMPLDNVAMATSSAISHFGLFAAVQGGMFGPNAAGLIAFIFAMPFLVHPLVFGLFGKAETNNGKMHSKIVLALSAIGILGVIVSIGLIL